MISNYINKLVGNNKYDIIHNTTNTYDFQYISSFKKQKIEKRMNISSKIITQYNNFRIPIIVDCQKGLFINKNKFIVPNDITVSQFLYILKKRIITNECKSVYLLCNNKMLIMTNTLLNVYSEYKNDDGFLYIYIIEENTFGK